MWEQDRLGFSSPSQSANAMTRDKDNLNVSEPSKKLGGQEIELLQTSNLGSGVRYSIKSNRRPERSSQSRPSTAY